MQDLLGDHRQVQSVEGRAGINRIHWNLLFEGTEEQKMAFATHLEERIETLVRMAKQDEQEKLAGFAERVGDARELILNPPEPSEEAEGEEEKEEEEAPDPVRDLNQIRRELTQSFRIYADGEPFFGGKLGPMEAAAGEYLVTLRVGGYPRRSHGSS